MAVIFGKTFVKKYVDYSKKISFRAKILLKSISYGFQAFLCFAIFTKNENGRHFWRDKNFLKIELTTLQRYPMDKTFRQNHSILHGFRDMSIFMFCNFGEISSKPRSCNKDNREV